MIVKSPKELKDKLSQCGDRFAFDTETIESVPHGRPSIKKKGALVLDRARMTVFSAFGFDANSVPIEICVPMRNHYGGDLMELSEFAKVVRPFMADASVLKIMHNANYDVNVMLNHGIPVNNIYCTSVASSMQDENAVSELKSRAASVGILLKKYKNVDPSDMESFCKYAEQDSKATMMLYMAFEGYFPLYEHLQICAPNHKLMTEIETPLLSTVIKMERRGMRIDIRKFLKIFQKVKSETIRMEAEIFKLAGKSFNINSTKQLQEILFGQLGLTPIEGTEIATGFSLKSSILSEMIDQHPIIPLLVEFAHAEKMAEMTNPISGIPSYADSLGYIHSALKTTGARTGRFSSSNPNLQNIPSETDLYGVREAFIAPDGYSMIVVDFAGMELTFMAALSNDPAMRKVLEVRGGDLHQQTADYFSVEATGVPGNIPRKVGKTFNFGIGYGMGPYTLSKRLKALGFDFSPIECKRFLDIYWSVYAPTKRFGQRLIEQYDRLGFIQYPSGRVRTVPFMHKAEIGLRRQGERQLVNTLIQGGCADLVKVCMLECDGDEQLNSWDCLMANTVHDELIFYVRNYPSNNVRRCLKRVQTILERPRFGLDMPFYVEIHAGNNWKEGKGK